MLPIQDNTKQISESAHPPAHAVFGTHGTVLQATAFYSICFFHGFYSQLEGDAFPSVDLQLGWCLSPSLCINMTDQINE
jgi:hypothetical protein